MLTMLLVFAAALAARPDIVLSNDFETFHSPQAKAFWKRHDIDVSFCCQYRWPEMPPRESLLHVNLTYANRRIGKTQNTAHITA